MRAWLYALGCEGVLLLQDDGRIRSEKAHRYLAASLYRNWLITAMNVPIPVSADPWYPEDTKKTGNPAIPGLAFGEAS